LRLDARERHFPGDPDLFRANSRLRQTNYNGWYDRSWNRVQCRWDKVDGDGPDFLGTDWDTILDLIRQQAGEERRAGQPWERPVTRPHDGRNVWRQQDPRRGFALELAESIDRSRTGANPNDPAPLYFDSDEFETGGAAWTALYFWFFHLIRWYGPLALQGDWKHVTLYFERKTIDKGGRPEFVYFASHTGGRLFTGDHPLVAWEEDTHPTVYVSRWGHATYPAVHERLRRHYTVGWRTWQNGLHDVRDEKWSAYDGAWGDVGDASRSTGPLGPLFERRRDRVATLRRMS
jgi:hypothetical protein